MSEEQVVNFGPVDTKTETPVETVETVKAELTEAEQAYLYLNQASKEFKSVAYQLAEKKKKGVARVLESVLFDPFIDVELLGKDEEMLLAFCRNILYYRDIAIKDVIAKNPEKFNSKGEVNESNTNEQK